MTFNGCGSPGHAFATGMLPNIAATCATVSYHGGSMMLCEGGIVG